MSTANDSMLLLECACVHPTTPQISRMRQLIVDGVDWSELLRLAIPHGLLPLISRNLSEHAADLVPPLTLVQLSLFRRRVEHRNKRQVEELLAVIGLFADNNIESLPFKGPTLALAAYGDLSLRESHDLDLWLRQEDLARAGLLLRATGYRGAAHKAGVPYLLNVDEGDQQTEYLSSDGEVLIELHDQLQSKQFSFSPPFDEVWGRRRQLTIDDTTVSIFSAEDLLLTLAAHGSKHLWRRLSWVVDIGALLEANPTFNWDILLPRAKRWHCKRRSLSALFLVKEVCASEVPVVLNQHFAACSSVRSANSRLLTNILEGTESRTIVNFLDEVRHHVRNADTVGDRFRIGYSFARKLLSVDESKMIRTMPQDTLWLYKISRGLRGLLGSLVRQD